MVIISSLVVLVPLSIFMLLSEVFNLNIFCNSHWHVIALQCWNGGKGY